MSEQKLGLFLDDERFPAQVYPNDKSVHWNRVLCHRGFKLALKECIECYGKFFEVISFDYYLDPRFDERAINGSLCFDLLLKHCEEYSLPIPECRFHTRDARRKKAMEERYTTYLQNNPQFTKVL